MSPLRDFSLLQVALYLYWLASDHRQWFPTTWRLRIQRSTLPGGVWFLCRRGPPGQRVLPGRGFILPFPTIPRHRGMEQRRCVWQTTITEADFLFWQRENSVWSVPWTSVLVCHISKFLPLHYSGWGCPVASTNTMPSMIVGHNDAVYFTMYSWSNSIVYSTCWTIIRSTRHMSLPRLPTESFSRLSPPRARVLPLTTVWLPWQSNWSLTPSIVVMTSYCSPLRPPMLQIQVWTHVSLYVPIDSIILICTLSDTRGVSR